MSNLLRWSVVAVAIAELALGGHAAHAQAAAGQVVAIPTLVRDRPQPKRLFIGDMIIEPDVATKLTG